MSTELLDVIALSPLQRGLYSVSNTSRGIDPYLVTFAVRVEQLTDPSTLRTAFDQLLQRYPQLGASVVSDDLPHPVLVLTTAGRIGWHEVDLRRTEDPVAAARRIYADEGRRRMNLDTGPLFRVTAARVAEHDYELICTAHHLVVDGWSVPLMFADLMALHRGAGATLPTPPPLRDHAAWLAAKDDAAAQRAWRTALADLAPMPMIVPPADPDLPVVGEARFGRPETDAVTAWARARGLTLNTLLQLTWARILSGLVGRDDVVFGQTTSGRDATLPGAEHLVGALVATIPVRVRVDERAPAVVAAQLQRQVAQLRTHEYLGMAEITRLAGAGQLFDTLLVFENVPVGAMTGAMELGHGARLIARRIDSPSHYPLTMVPIVEHGELVSRVEIRPDLISRFDPDRLAHRMLVVLRRLLTADRYCDVDILLDDESPSLQASVLAAQPISDPARRSGHPRALSGAADVPGAVGAETPGPGGLASTPDEGGAVATSDPAGDRGVDPGDHAHGPVALSVAGGTAATTDAPGVQAAGPGPRASAPDAVADLDRSVAQTLGSGGDFSVPGVSVAAGGAVAATDVAGAEVVGSDDHANAPEALLAAADAAGDAVAVIDTAGAQTFAEFGSAVRALAANLRALGLPPGGAVAVVLPRDRRVLHAPFAIGLAGGVCVHVDPATPVDRLAYLLETAQVRVVLGDAALASALAAVRASGVEVLHAIPDGDGGLQVDAELLTYTGSAVAVPSAESPFYVIFTSGTTGRPKGVAVPHRALDGGGAGGRCAARVALPSGLAGRARLAAGSGDRHRGFHTDGDRGRGQPDR